MFQKWWTKLKTPPAPLKPEIYSGQNFGQAPRSSFPLAPLLPGVRSSCTGPDNGVACLADLPSVTFDGPTDWAFGQATSLYDAAQPGSEARAGDPIADCFAIISYDTHTLLAVADGVNWGEPAKRAARSAVAGSVAYLHQQLAGLSASGQPPLETTRVFQLMIKALDPAQKLILSQFGTLTTLVLTIIARLAAPLKKHSLKPASPTSSSPCYRWAALTLTVGDSSAFVYRQQGEQVEELTYAASAGAYRDPRWTPGALGYANGDEPDLSNMTCSLTLLSQGDLVFLTSDGVADNFDPFMLKMARQAIVAPQMGFNDGSWSDGDEEGSGTASGRGRQLPVMTSEQSHEKKMELLTAAVQALRQRQQRGAGAGGSAGASSSASGGVGGGGDVLGARALVEGLLAHVNEVTHEQRKWSERRHRTREDSRRRSLSKDLQLPSLATDTRSSNKDSMPPGKMDHATVAAFLVGA